MWFTIDDLAGVDAYEILELYGPNVVVVQAAEVRGDGESPLFARHV